MAEYLLAIDVCHNLRCSGILLIGCDQLFFRHGPGFGNGPLSSAAESYGKTNHEGEESTTDQ
jgi:hypothetical protein